MVTKGEGEAVLTQRVVFCDFDGTITERDGFVRVCRNFAPEAVEKYLPGVMDGSISLREGLTEILESIDSSHLEAMRTHCDDIPMRPGLEMLIEWLAEREVPFVVISGGLKELVLRKLGPLAEKAHGVYAPELDASDEKLKVLSAFPGERELLDKVAVMKNHPCEESIAIGDGITDFQMAKEAHVVFAQRQLAEFMEEQKMPFYSWNNFDDIRYVLSGLWE